MLRGNTCGDVHHLRALAECRRSHKSIATSHSQSQSKETSYLSQKERYGGLHERTRVGERSRLFSTIEGGEGGEIRSSGQVQVE